MLNVEDSSSRYSPTTPPPSPTTGERRYHISDGLTQNKQTENTTNPAPIHNNMLESSQSNSDENYNLDTSYQLNTTEKAKNSNSLSYILSESNRRFNASMDPRTNGYQVQELIDTEMQYCKDLSEIIHGYLEYLERTPELKIDLMKLFSNIREIKLLHNEFLDHLNQSKSLKDIAETFTSRKNQFVTEYTNYCNNYPNACQILKRINVNNDMKIISAFRICQQSLNHLLPLGAYLLKPVQRILKYHLVIKAMVNEVYGNGETASNEMAMKGEQEMREALFCMSTVAEEINSMKRKHEQEMHINEIQSLIIGWHGNDINFYGELLKEGSLKIKGFRRERIVFLFEKLFLIVKREEEFYTQPMHILMENFTMLESPKEGNHCLKVYEHKNPQNSFMIEFTSQSAKREWVVILKELIIRSGPILNENNRKRILDAIHYSTDAESLNTSHDPTPLMKLKEFTKIKQKFKKSKSKRLTPSPNFDLKNELTPPKLRHSNTFSMDLTNRDMSAKIKRYSETSNTMIIYDDFVLENTIRVKDKLSRGSSSDKILTRASKRFRSPQSVISQPIREMQTFPKHATNPYFSIFPENTCPISPSISISKIKVTPQNSNSLETTTDTIFDDSITRMELSKERSKSEKRLLPDILDSLEGAGVIAIAKKSDGSSDGSPVPPEIEFTRNSGHETDTSTNDEQNFSQEESANSPERHSQLLLSKNQNFGSVDFKRSKMTNSPDYEGVVHSTPLRNDTDENLKVKTNSQEKRKSHNSLVRNKSARRNNSMRLNSTSSISRKRLQFDDEKLFSPDPNILTQSPKDTLTRIFVGDLGNEMKFKSKMALSDLLADEKVRKSKTLKCKRASLSNYFDLDIGSSQTNSDQLHSRPASIDIHDHSFEDSLNRIYSSFTEIPKRPLLTNVFSDNKNTSSEVLNHSIKGIETNTTEIEIQCAKKISMNDSFQQTLNNMKSSTTTNLESSLNSNVNIKNVDDNKTDFDRDDDTISSLMAEFDQIINEAQNTITNPVNNPESPIINTLEIQTEVSSCENDEAQNLNTTYKSIYEIESFSDDSSLALEDNLQDQNIKSDDVNSNSTESQTNLPLGSKTEVSSCENDEAQKLNTTYKSIYEIESFSDDSSLALEVKILNQDQNIKSGNVNNAIDVNSYSNSIESQTNLPIETKSTLNNLTSTELEASQLIRDSSISQINTDYGDLETTTSPTTTTISPTTTTTSPTTTTIDPTTTTNPTTTTINLTTTTTSRTTTTIDPTTTTSPTPTTINSTTTTTSPTTTIISPTSDKEIEVIQKDSTSNLKCVISTEIVSTLESNEKSSEKASPYEERILTNFLHANEFTQELKETKINSNTEVDLMSHRNNITIDLIKNDISRTIITASQNKSMPIIRGNPRAIYFTKAIFISALVIIILGKIAYSLLFLY